MTFRCHRHHYQRSRPSLVSPSSPSVDMLFLLIVCILISGLHSLTVLCPQQSLVQTLVPQLFSSPIANNSKKSNSCDCTKLQEGGWEIVCYTDSVTLDGDYVQPTASDDYPLTTYNTLPVGFSVKYEVGRPVEVSCDKSVVEYRPAMFQGFGIESVDSFHFTGCPLPSSLPFNVILHRASTLNVATRSKIQPLDSNSNKVVSRIRSLVIKSPVVVNSTQLNLLFTGLDDLEQLRLFQVELAVDDIFVDRRQNLSKSELDKIERTKIRKNSFNFGHKFPKLKHLKLHSFLTKPTSGFLLTEMLKDLPNLEYLEIDSSNLNISANAFSGSKNSLKKLYLYNNVIENLESEVFADLSEIEILDLSRNGLQKLPPIIFKDLSNLKHLSIKGNSIQQISGQLLHLNSKLGSLDLSLNRNLTELPIDLFAGLNQITNFSVNDCQLAQLNQHPELFFAHGSNLENVEMRGNQLKNLTAPGLFANNNRLKRLDFSYNQITDISSEIFSSNSSSIIELNLYGNELFVLPENLFFYLRNLKRLNLGFNQLKETIHSVFLPLQELEEINLSKNQITTINSKENSIPFGLGPNLKKINLSQNNLTDFDSDLNTINWSLYIKISEIDVHSNQFNGTLRVPIFSSSISQVIKLDLSHNKFSSVDVSNLINYDSFALQSDSNELKNSNNRYLSSSIETKTWQTHVRLDNNPINCDCHLEPFLRYARSTSRSLAAVKSSESVHRQTIFFIDEEWGLTCNEPDSLKNLALGTVELSQLLCDIEDEQTCPKICNCSYRSVDKTAIIDCDKREIRSLAEEWQFKYHNVSLTSNVMIERLNGVILQLRHNYINDIKKLQQIFSTKSFSNSPSYIEIYLDHNNISTVEDIFPDISSDNDTINSTHHALVKVLSFSNNNIQQVPLKFLTHLILFINKSQDKRDNLDQSESRVFLGDNPFNCSTKQLKNFDDCQTRQFKSWLTRHHRIVGDINNIKCAFIDYNVSSVIVEIPDDVLCPILSSSQDETVLLSLTITCLILATSLFVVSILYYRNKQTILAFIYIHFNPIFICLSFNEQDLDEDKIYDAFVSYSSADRDVVMQLIEQLEKPNKEANLIFQQTTGASIHENISDQIVPENEFKKSHTNLSKPQIEDAEIGNDDSYFKLCIHERDWLPGNLISWNIINSVKNSKRTILVLSKDFINSIWFQVEFHTAYYQMLEDKIDRLIVIVKGQLPPKEELDKDLVFLLTTKTYLVWGEKWFWEKLRYALPHKRASEFKNFPKVAANTTNGLTLSSTKNGLSNNKSTEVMKQFVDKTIANHFNLEMPTNSSSGPKSLRNSASMPQKAQRAKNSEGHDNQSFVVETPT